MHIKGIQKLTLLDYPGHTACTVFTGGCQLRCPFCHNPSLVLEPESQCDLDEEALWDFLRRRRGLLDGVCVSGGEPLLQPELPNFLARLRELGYQIKLDTNGLEPGQLQDLAADGLLDYVAMDIKNCPARYGETTGRPELDVAPILASVEWLRGSGLAHEFRTTVSREFHSPAELTAIGRWLAGPSPYYIQPFREAPDLVGTIPLHTPSRQDLDQLIAAVLPFLPNAALRGID